MDVRPKVNVIAGGGLSRFIIPWDVGPKVNDISGGGVGGS